MTDDTEVEANGSRWVWVPVGLLVASTLGVGSLAAIAVHDPSFALEPNYYDKALHWDLTQAQAADNQRLGYAIRLDRGMTLDAAGKASVRVRIVDASGRDANDAIVSGLAFANAYAGDSTPLVFERVESGVYAATWRARHLGLWELRLIVDRGSARVTSTLRGDVVRGAG